MRRDDALSASGPASAHESPITALFTTTIGPFSRGLIASSSFSQLPLPIVNDDDNDHSFSWLSLYTRPWPLVPECVGRGPFLVGRTCSHHARKHLSRYSCASLVPLGMKWGLYLCWEEYCACCGLLLLFRRRVAMCNVYGLATTVNATQSLRLVGGSSPGSQDSGRPRHLPPQSLHDVKNQAENCTCGKSTVLMVCTWFLRYIDKC